MARTIDEIFEEQRQEAIRLADEAGNTDALDMYNNNSRLAIWRLLFYTMAYCAWGLEKIFDSTVSLIDGMIANLTPHSLRWYRSKALAFQYGFDLIPETDKYDNTGKTDNEIAGAKVVKYAAVNETTIDERRVLLIKIAGVDNDGKLVQLPQLVEDAFVTYMERVRDAGNVLIIYNREADVLRTTVDVFYNPLLLDGSGNRLDGLGGKPLEEAALQYLLSRPFNGEFSNAGFIDALQNAYGVNERNVFLRSMERKINENDYQSVGNTFIPDAGYARFADTAGLNINYIPQT